MSSEVSINFDTIEHVGYKNQTFHPGHRTFNSFHAISKDHGTSDAALRNTSSNIKIQKSELESSIVSDKASSKEVK